MDHGEQNAATRPTAIIALAPYPNLTQKNELVVVFRQLTEP